MYVIFYGICCVRSKGILKIINGIFFDNLILIKECVFSFKDNDGNFIFYFIIILNYFDEFVVFVVENIVKNGVLIDLINGNRISFLMFVVE